MLFRNDTKLAKYEEWWFNNEKIELINAYKHT